MESLGKVGVDIPADDPADLTVTFNQFLLLMEELDKGDVRYPTADCENP